MKIGLVSDIHCNIKGLHIALERMGDIDELWCAGDVVFQFRWNNEVVQVLRERASEVVLGNHEEVILGREGERALANPTVDHDLVDWLKSRPWRIEREVDGKRVLLTHGSPWDPWRDYHYPHEAVWHTKAPQLPFDVVIVGHTHFQMAQRFGHCLVINPGSAGDPRDHRNNFQLSCAVWDTTTDDVTFYDFPDPNRQYVASAASQ